jgi:acetyl esterase
MPLHAQAASVLAQVPPVWREIEEINAMTPAKARALETEAMVLGDSSLPAGVVVDEIEVPGAVGPLRARMHAPSTKAPVGTVMWIRGGGFVVGSLETDRIPAPLALASGCTVLSFEYRLAPEHPFPAAIEDCYSVLCWAAGQGPALRGRTDPIAVGGDSAGGNLAAAVALMARDRGAPQLALQVLLYPMTVRHFDSPSRRDPKMAALARTEAMEWFWRQYLGDRDGSDPLASPLYAETHADLPPALVITAEYDVLRDEGEAYADRLRRAGVAVRSRRFGGMHHGFADSPGLIDAADECIEYMGEGFRQALSSQGRDMTTGPDDAPLGAG